MIPSPQRSSCRATPSCGTTISLPPPLPPHTNTARLRHHLLMCSQACKAEYHCRCRALCFPSAVLSGSSSLVEHIKGILSKKKKKAPEEPQVLEDGKHCRLRGRRSRGGWRSSGCETAVVRGTQTTPLSSSSLPAAQKCQQIDHADRV